LGLFDMQEFLDTKSLVVGGAGFVGSNLVRALIDSGSSEIVVVDNLLSAEERNLPQNRCLTFIKGSITSDDVLSQIDDEYDYIFQLATYHGNQSSIQNPLIDHENNTLTTLKLCERIRDFKSVKKIVYSSAGCTVAEKTFETAHATTEDAPLSLYLDSPYQISKIIGELYFNYYFKLYGMPVVKARFQNVYGPGEILGAGDWRGTQATVWRNVTPTFIYNAIKHRPLPVENGGIATRDFIYVDDIVRGLMLCAVKGGEGQVYNLASGVETSIKELGEIINELAGNSTPISLKPARNWDHSGKRFGSTEKAKNELGFEKRIGFVEGLTHTIQWAEDHLELIERCIEKHKDKMGHL